MGNKDKKYNDGVIVTNEGRAYIDHDTFFKTEGVKKCIKDLRESKLYNDLDKEDT